GPPLLCRLYRNHQGLTKGQRRSGAKVPRPADPNHPTRPQLAREMIALVASGFPGRQLLVSGDSAYGGGSVRAHLPANVDLHSRVAPPAALAAPPPVPP